MQLIILTTAIITFIAILFFVYAGILFLLTKLFKLEGSSYRKSLLILILWGIASGVIRFVFSAVNLGMLSLVLSVVGSFYFFYFFLKKYYSTSWKRALCIYAVYGVISVLAMLIIVVPARMFLFEPFVVIGQAMSPTYNSGDYLLINKLSKSFSRGDVVVVRLQEKNIFLVKRIIGLPTEKIEIKNGAVTINDQVLDETYYKGNTPGNISTTLSQNQFFVLGDNRTDSYDSRSFGPVSLSDIAGRIFFEVPGLVK